MAGTIIVILALHATNNYRTLKAGRLLGGSLLGVALLIAASLFIRIETAPPFSRIVLLLAAALIPIYLLVERHIVLRLTDSRKSKKAEQAGAGYPPQGVGSPDP
jgi:cadmium resistance protein CadD (predicted permease)